MKSMTGFGRAIAEHAGTRVIAEVRALNQRFFELKIAVPRGWGEHEAEIRKSVQSVVARGRVEVFIKSVAVKPPPVRLEVNDDGHGFTPDTVRENGHYGITGMRERVEQSGGTFEVHSSPGHGTQVIARLPRGLTND